MVSLMDLFNPSTIKMKRKGKSGFPCLIPLEREKGLEGMPLTKIENKVEDVRLKIQETQEESNKNARRVGSK